MRHEGFDFTKDIWSEKESMSDKNNIWSGNIAVPHLIFDDIKKFEKEMGDKFKLHHQKIYEWRKEASENETKKKRPDLYIKYVEKKKK